MKKKEEDLIKQFVDSQPLKLLALVNDREANMFANSFLPFSVGFEIECEQGETFDIGHFQNIPNIMAVNCDTGEQRFRIPSGIEGMICLWHITEALALNSKLNYGSGIHYHIDMTNYWSSFNTNNIKANANWMLEELDTWGYKGTYNTRTVSFDCNHNWVRFQPYFKTAEFRLGEMTFSYKTLIKRMISASSIMKQLVENLGVRVPTYVFKEVYNPEELLLFEYVKGMAVNARMFDLQRKLKTLTQEQVEEEENIEEIIRNRIIT